MFFFHFFCRCRSRGEQLDSIGIQAAMEINRNHHRNPSNTTHLVNGNGSVEQWTKLSENGHDQVRIKCKFNEFTIFDSNN